jgi:hypothetical protein
MCQDTQGARTSTSYPVRLRAVPRTPASAKKKHKMANNGGCDRWGSRDREVYMYIHWRHTSPVRPSLPSNVISTPPGCRRSVTSQVVEWHPSRATRTAQTETTSAMGYHCSARYVSNISHVTCMCETLAMYVHDVLATLGTRPALADLVEPCPCSLGGARETCACVDLTTLRPAARLRVASCMRVWLPAHVKVEMHDCVQAQLCCRARPELKARIHAHCSS